MTVEREQQIEALARAITANFAKRNVPLDLAVVLLDPDVGSVSAMLAEAKRQGSEEERARLAADPRELLALVSQPRPDDGLQGPTTDELVESWKRQGAVEALRHHAEVWAESAWQDAYLIDDVSDDVGSVQSAERWLKYQAAQIEQGGPIGG